MDSRVEQDDEWLVSAIESVLLISSDPVPVSALVSATQRPRERVERALSRMVQRRQGGIRVQRHEELVQLVSAPENAEVVQRFLGTEKPAPLSRAALETLAVVAYRQPVTRAEVEAVRGVDSDHALRRLLARGLIEERGRLDTVGRPAVFGTTMAFLEYFGLSTLDELPPLPEDPESVLEPAGLGLRQ